jgi:hypothetical protein
MIRDMVPVEEGPSEWIHDERKKKIEKVDVG